MQQRPRVTACFFGDGAVAEGEFHESLNLAALWKLPVLFLCENNLYAMGTRIERAQSQTDLAAKAASYGMPAEAVDGMDVLAVEAATRRAADARAGAATGRVSSSAAPIASARTRCSTPSCIATRPKSRQWKQRDPIATSPRGSSSAATLRRRGVRGARSRGGATRSTEAVAFAEAGTWEPVETC